ncbi:MAG TPA: hypothetical protein VFY44_09865 [Thermoleophilaceae bacterium]|nr:hypothetical protein [Thermoleophilaceae bacterium]
MNPTPWWFWLVALIVAPIIALALFVGLFAVSGWSGSGAWVAGAIAIAVGGGAVIWVGEGLRIDRLWTGVGVVLASLAAPGWLFGAIVLLMAITCPEAGCFQLR